MPEGSQPAYEIALTHFIVSDDVERSRRFYTEVLGGKTIRSGEPTYVALANSWIIINVGGGPTEERNLSHGSGRAAAPSRLRPDHEPIRRAPCD